MLLGAANPIRSVAAGVLTAFFSGLLAVGAEPAVDFDSQIRPILSDRCYVCHGPDGENRQADLRLDLEESAKADAIRPGRPADSELIRRITSDDPDLRMPPADSKLSLRAEEVALLRQWIAEGAPWKPHWAFVAPAAAQPPSIEADWVRNEIDRFTLPRMQAAGLQPSPRASKERLIRRLSFDLTGLPPTIQELDAFLADESAGAYERLVDRLLQSQRYGERMTADWLDAARYSDTYGYQVDRDRHVWPWRDWVIRAFNDNLPYDKFLLLQLAGDLLPGGDEDDVLATTFNRLHPQKVEGGSTPEEFRIEYVADRAQTFASTMLGLTLECCRCHDHKYDPLSQKEYYQLTAFFDKIDEAGLYSYFTPAVPTPTLLLPTAQASQRLSELHAAQSAAETSAVATARKRQSETEAWLAAKPQPEIPGRIAHLDFEQLAAGPNKPVAGPAGKAVRLTGDDGIGLQVGNFRRSQPFSVALWMNTPDLKQRAVVFHRSRAWTDAGSRGYQLLLEDGRLSASLIHFWPGNAIGVRVRDPLPIGQWKHVAVTYDGSSRADGLRIHVDGRAVDCEVVQDQLTKQITGGGGDNITIGERFRDRGFADGMVDEFQVYDRELTALEVAQLHDNRSLSEALAAGRPTDALRQYYLATADEPAAAARLNLQQARDALNKSLDGVTEIMVMRESRRGRQTYLLRRGAYDARGEPVDPGTPQALPPLDPEAPRNRLGLAVWLTRPDHPLTSRVAVNRCWQMLFGAGLVRTPEDFGRQGEPPTHPELLDWLARDFVAHGWDVKRLLKQIVMSATYQQQSDATAELLQRDPQNLWLARAPAHRLPAEMLRDNALAVSGLLVERIGGPPARPYELESSFKPVKRDAGDGLYRRSVYTYWKRTGPAPVMMTLDAAKRDVCRLRRERTSTPLEALVLMNGPQFVEASRVLAEDLLRTHAADRGALQTELFRRLTARRPAPAELQILDRLHSQQREHFAADPQRAAALLKIGDRPADPQLDPVELAAAAALANALLSFDEAVSKR